MGSFFSLVTSFYNLPFSGLSASWQLLFGLNPNEQSRKSSSNTAFRMSLSTFCTNLSSYANIPRGRILLEPALGMNTLFIGCGL